MPKYTLTVNTDDINDLVQCLTPALVAAVKGGQVLTAQPSEPTEVKGVEEAEAKPAAKRGRKPKAEAESAPVAEALLTEEKVEEEPATEDFSDALADEIAEEAVVTKQQVTDVAVEVGAKHGRDTMVAAIGKFTAPGKPTFGKLVGVAESDYPKLHALLTEMSAAKDKASAKKLLEAV